MGRRPDQNGSAQFGVPVVLLAAIHARRTRGPRWRDAALLARVGLADRADDYPDRLSGGEQQRVAIVRALIHQPRLVLADEPTGNLDARTGEQILDLLDRLIRKKGHTLIMVTHSAEVASRADRVVRLVGGKIEADQGP